MEDEGRGGTLSTDKPTLLSIKSVATAADHTAGARRARRIRLSGVSPRLSEKYQFFVLLLETSFPRVRFFSRDR